MSLLSEIIHPLLVQRVHTWQLLAIQRITKTQ
jgi:hypothetical protein